jgi:hypothetical protein
MAFLAPLFVVGLLAVGVPIFVHLIQRERKTVIEFPSLMFLRQIPYQSVERRRIHNWPLLLLRAAAMALVVLAFARPFFKQDPIKAAAAEGAREVVILLDRSASMGYGTHWAHAQDEARKIVNGLTGDDRATLVLFDRGVEEAVRATSSRPQLNGAIAQATVSSGATRYAPALREAQSLLSRSDRGRKEAYLISDFQKSGWERQEDIHFPAGATITPVSVGELVTADLAVTSVAIQRASFSGEERVTLTAGLANHSGSPVTQPVKLEMDGHTIDTRPVTIPPNASGSVTFDTFTVAESNMQGIVSAGSDAMPKDNAFYFVLSPSRPVSVLMIQGDSANRESSLYMTTGLGLSKAPPFRVDVVTAARVTPGMLDGRAVVILNNATALSTDIADRLRRFVEQGGGLFIVLGDRTPAGNDWALLPGALGQPVDRLGSHGGTLGYIDYSHPIFEQFKDRNGNFANMRFLRYRGLVPGPNDRVLARFDDGAIAMVERRVGSGRVIAFASTLDNDWNDAPQHPMFVPLLHETMRYLAQYKEPEASYAVGQRLDMSIPLAEIVREGQASTTAGAARGGTAVVVSPSGKQTTLGQGGASSIELADQGFYAVRLPGSGNRRPYAVAVNLEAAESDLSPLSPTEFLAGVTGRAAVAAGQSLEQATVTPVDIEKKQSLWWFLLVAGLVALLIETALSNRLSGRRHVPAEV